MTTLVKSCTNCGTKLRVQAPSGNGRVRFWAEHVGLVCEPCSVAYEREQAEQEAQRRREVFIANSGMPSDLRDLHWEDMDRSGGRGEVIDLARAWAQDEFAGLLLCGSTGTGKTRLAATAVWERLNRPRPMRWVSVARLVVMDRSGFGSDEKGEATRLLTGSGPLALDDLDKVKPTESVKSLLFVAIDNRVQAASPLLVTTNLNPQGLHEQFDEPIASRLLGYCKVQVLGGRDRRLVA